MSEQVRVELFHRESPADDATLQHRESVVERLYRLGQLDTETDGQVNDTVSGWAARINGAEFPVVTFSVEPGGEGDGSLVSLLIDAGSVHVGLPATPPQRPAVEEKSKVSAWGAPGRPDPRESIPGWVPGSLAEQVAGNAVRLA